jgi:predicted GIY-YIG superfamily endonuclease
MCDGYEAYYEAIQAGRMLSCWPRSPRSKNERTGRSPHTQLYRHFDADGVLLYIGISISAVSRLATHRCQSGWYNDITRVEIETFDTREDALAAEEAAIRAEKPLHNKEHND